jgi:hypothetical protein
VALTISYLLASHPPRHRNYAAPYTMKELISDEIIWSPNKRQYVLVNLYEVERSDKLEQRPWSQLILLSGVEAAMYFLADKLTHFKEEGKWNYVKLNNFFWDWHIIKYRTKMLTKVIQLILDGRKYQPELTIPESDLLPVKSEGEIPSNVLRFLKVFAEKIDALKSLRGELGKLSPDVDVYIFCSCPFFKYYGPYYTSNVRFNTGLKAVEASKVYDRIRYVPMGYTVYDKIVSYYFDPNQYELAPPKKKRIKIKTKKRVGKLPPGEIILEPEEEERYIEKEKKVVGYPWYSYIICKHLYAVLDRNGMDLKRAFITMAEKLNDEMQVMWRRAKYLLVQDSLQSDEFRVIIEATHKLEHRLDLLMEQGKVAVNVSDLIHPGVSIITVNDIVVPRYIGSAQSKPVKIPTGTRISFCCKLRGPEPPFYRFVAHLKNKKVELDIPEPEIMIILKNVKPEIKQWRGIYTPEPAGFAFA